MFIISNTMKCVLAVKATARLFGPREFLLSDPNRAGDLIANAPKFHGNIL